MSRETFLNAVYPTRRQQLPVPTTETIHPLQESSSILMPAGSEADSMASGADELPVEGLAPSPPDWTMEGPRDRSRLSLADLPLLQPLQFEDKDDVFLTPPEFRSEAMDAVDQWMKKELEPTGAVSSQSQMTDEDWLWEGSFNISSPTPSEEEILITED